MRLLLTTLLAIQLSPLFGGGYVVEWTPLFPTEDQPITITFFAQRGTGGLAGYTGDVYAHTGVITNLSSQPTDWRYVKTAWGQNTDDTKLTRVGQDTFQLHIDNIRAYYGVPAAEKILKLAFVFRSADAQKEGKAAGGADIFIDIYESGANVYVVEPAVSPLNPFITSVDTTVLVKAVGNSIGSTVVKMEILVNGSVVKESFSETIELAFVLTAPGRTNVNVVVVDGNARTDTASFYFVYNAPIHDEPLPTGIIDGINYGNDPTEVTLSLFAPYKQFVYVLGDFNNWEVDPAYYMNRYQVNDDTVHYWLTITGLVPGQEYAFQYFVDGKIRIADPYADKILDRWNDPYIPDDVYPNLKPYPVGKTELPVSILQTNQAPYQWKTQNFNPPAKDRLVIYELLVRDFTEKHDFKTLRDTLDYLERLVINSIELMPVNEFEGNSSWGYNPDFYFAPDKYYGPKNDLKAFIDEAHRRGIAVIMDIVLNHAYGQSPFVRLYNDGLFGKPTAENPWFNQDNNFANPDARYGYDFNHESPATQALVDRITSYWLSEYHFDGFRFDFTKGFTNNFKSMEDPWGSAYDADRIRILERIADAIWTNFPEAYVILEHFADSQEEKELADHGMLLWANANYNFNEATMGYTDHSNLAWTYYKNNGWNQPGMVTYMESHDEERLMYKNLKYGDSNGPYDVKKLNVALERMKLAGAFFFLIPGPKMIWQFGELGYDYSIDTNGRVGEKPIRWDYLNEPARKELYNTWSTLIHLRNTYPVFNATDSELETRLVPGVKSIKYSHPSMDAYLVGNFTLSPKEVELALPYGGTW